MDKEKIQPELTGKARVLIIDDDKGMSYTLKRMVTGLQLENDRLSSALAVP